MASSPTRSTDAVSASETDETPRPQTERLRPVPDTREAGHPPEEDGEDEDDEDGTDLAAPGRPKNKRALRRETRRARREAGKTRNSAAPRREGGPKSKSELRREARQARREAEKARAEAEAEPVVVRPLARPAKVKKRHWGLVVSFMLLVLAPVAVSGWYLYTRAVDQYASTLGFTVRSEDISSASDLFGGLGSTLGGGANNDAEILYEYIRSQEIVRRIDDKLDLRALYARHYETDPLLSFDPDGTIEDLTDYWERMLRISYDSGSGLIEMRVLAFDPVEARDIAQEIYLESSETVNELSAVAREDATRYARADLDLAQDRLKEAREALTAFRVENQIVDPSADIQGQMGLLNTLQGQLAASLIDLDLLGDSVGEGDPRASQAQRRIEVIRARIAQEREKFGANGQGPTGENYATTISEFERLNVEREFAETAYTAALAAYDGAQAEAERQSRYLATYIRPTLAERAQFPQREMMIGMVALFGFLAWAIGSLVYYSLRDRR